MSALAELLPDLKTASPFPFGLNARRCLKLDLSRNNLSLADLNAADATQFNDWVWDAVHRAGADYAAGGYGEDRAVYEVSPQFRDPDGRTRSIHLGVDLWMPVATPVHAVLDGLVHSTADNARFGDYGPTIVLEHRFEGQVFHTLYGHLSRASLKKVRAGDRVRAGEEIGWLGAPGENLGWPPHLHFQVIRDMEGRRGDYPGVCLLSEKAVWLQRCPDPNLLLHIAALKPVRDRA
ncbi:MAG TPA: peptidoglycan DD-metalloendopeptidase family protein [Nevskiaceae bacterium]|nr:peptidoglycan DD-metalloendopeptidase family protein [Nevskiaceae bacterium]